MGIDLDGPMLKQARKRYPDACFIRADMTSIPLPDGAFEGVISMFRAMGHLPPTGQEAMVREVWRVLQPGGLAVLTNGNLRSPFGLPTTITRGRIPLKAAGSRPLHRSRKFPIAVRFPSIAAGGLRLLLRTHHAVEVRVMPAGQGLPADLW